MNVIWMLKAKLKALETRFIDILMGVKTLGTHAGKVPSGSKFGDSKMYQSKCYIENWLYLRRLRLKPDDVFYDIGCGAGRVIVIAAIMGVRKCVGVEVSEDLCRIARNNALSRRFVRSAIEIKQADASLLSYDDGTVFYLFNPFGSATAAAFLDSLHQSVIRNPRTIKLVYVYPEDEHREMFARQKWLQIEPPRFTRYGGKVKPCYMEYVPN